MKDESRDEGGAMPRTPRDAEKMRYSHVWVESMRMPGAEICQTTGCGIIRRLDGKSDAHLCAAAIRLESLREALAKGNAP